jgi:hypothetical protein
MGIIAKMTERCQMAAKKYGSTDVAGFVGIQPTLVNKFIERDQYGVVASVQSGGRGKERIFSENDVYGIALVHWLFESGLRSDAIQFVLNQICGGRRESRANDAAARLMELGAEVLTVTREPRTGYARHPDQTTRWCSLNEAAQLIRDASTRSVLVIPVANLFAKLRNRLENN